MLICVYEVLTMHMYSRKSYIFKILTIENRKCEEGGSVEVMIPGREYVTMRTFISCYKMS